jgi:hypothetical protein
MKPKKELVVISSDRHITFATNGSVVKLISDMWLVPPAMMRDLGVKVIESR